MLFFASSVSCHFNPFSQFKTSLAYFGLRHQTKSCKRATCSLSWIAAACSMTSSDKQTSIDSSQAGSVETFPYGSKSLQQSAIQIYTMLVFEAGEMQIKLPVAVLLPLFLSVGEFPGIRITIAPHFISSCKKIHTKKSMNLSTGITGTQVKQLLLACCCYHPSLERTISPPQSCKLQKIQIRFAEAVARSASH